jgi:uncharacterized protein YeaC (DUF1315 family)
MMANESNSFDALLNSITPEIHEKLKDAVATGRWANGDKLTPEQLENSMQAVIAWELTNLPEEQRTGYIDRTGLQKSQCDDSPEEQSTLTWKEKPKHTTH